MKKTKKAIALVLAGALMSGCFVGCDLVTKDPRKDLAQKVATVDITRSENFAEGGIYNEYKDVISEAVVLKRDMVSYYYDGGYTYQNYYGYTRAQTMEAICQALVMRQLKVQYAMAYFLDSEDYNYTVAGYKEKIGDGKDELAGLAYFLDGEGEVEKAEYSTKRFFNNSLDSFEPRYIKTEDEDSSSSVEQRTLPTGVDTANSDYYDEGYAIYTGKNKPDECGTYEALDHSTVTTRKKAYNEFLSYLNTYNLLEIGENTNNIEELSYYQYELKSAYESALLTKLTEDYEKKAEERLNNAAQNEDGTQGEDSVTKYYDKLFAEQTAQYADKDTFESKLDSISNDTFLLTAPQEGYGYVINILLPFSALQSAEVQSLQGNPDSGDPNGNYFVQRASILKKLKAIDQRASWFTGEKDYSFKGEGYKGAKNDSARQYLFFEDSLNEVKEGVEPQYEPLKNYYGKYTYNGSVAKKDDKYILAPNQITIDDFIDEMEGYLKFAGFTTSPIKGFTDGEGKGEGYYAQSVDDYYTDKATGKVNYDSFVYYAGKVNFNGFDANKMFVAGSDENKAFSIINELSFAYNTDTAGLNPYLGYSIVTGKTSFVDEFEYASQEACKAGAGTYYIVPSDYGWHIIYCTFSFTEAGGKAFEYKEAEKDEEGSFSYYFYESIKADFVKQYSDTQDKIVNNAYSDCKTIYEKAYKDLLG